LREVLIKVAFFKNAAIVELGIEPCSNTFTIYIEKNKLILCNFILELYEEIPSFSYAIFKFNKKPYFVECRGNMCVASRLDWKSYKYGDNIY